MLPFISPCCKICCIPVVKRSRKSQREGVRETHEVEREREREREREG